MVLDKEIKSLEKRISNISQLINNLNAKLEEKLKQGPKYNSIQLMIEIQSLLEKANKAINSLNKKNWGGDFSISNNLQKLDGRKKKLEEYAQIINKTIEEEARIKQQEEAKKKEEEAMKQGLINKIEQAYQDCVLYRIISISNNLVNNKTTFFNNVDNNTTELTKKITQIKTPSYGQSTIEELNETLETVEKRELKLGDNQDFTPLNFDANDFKSIILAMNKAVSAVGKGESSSVKKQLLDKIKDDFRAASKNNDNLSASVYLALFVQVAGAHRNKQHGFFSGGKPNSLNVFIKEINTLNKPTLSIFIEDPMNTKNLGTGNTL